MKNEQCHICLEYVEHNPENLLKNCCNAFICNSCWTILKEDPNTHQCPICKKNIREYIETSTQTNRRTNTSLFDNIMYILCYLLVCLMASITSLIALVYIVNYDDMDEFKKDIKYIFKYSLIDFYIWIVLILWGYILINLFKPCFTSLCN